MTYYKYLGYGVTNSEGVAHLDHDADGEPIDHSYTGVGAGEIDVLASLDNPIVDGSIVSGTLNVLDCIVKDVNNSLPTSSYTKSHNADTLTENEDYKEFNSSETSARRLYLLFNCDTDFKIEWEGYVSNIGNIGLYDPLDNGSGKYAGISNYNSWTYFRLTKTNNSLSFEISTDGVNWTTASLINQGTLDLTKTSYRLLFTTNTGSHYFKNVKVYPI